MLLFGKNELKWLSFLLGLALLFGCSDQIKQERTFEGQVKRSSNGEIRENIRVSVLQDNGKEFPNNSLETDNQIVGEDGRFSVSINPFNNEEASDVRLLAQVYQLNQASGGLVELFYTIGDITYSKNEVLEQDEGTPFTTDLLTEDFGFLTIDFTIANGDIPRGWQASLRVYNDFFSHSVNLTDNDFLGTMKFPVKAGEEFTIQMIGSKSGESIEILEKFTINVSPGEDSEVTFEITI
jgi:hypothetical protein